MDVIKFEREIAGIHTNRELLDFLEPCIDRVTSCASGEVVRPERNPPE